MPDINKIFYFANIFPGIKANHLQRAKMLDSFTRNSVEAKFILRRLKESTENIKSLYDLRSKPECEEIGSIKILPIRYDFYYKLNLTKKLRELNNSETRETAAIYARYDSGYLVEKIAQFKVNRAPKPFLKFVVEVHQDDYNPEVLKLLDGVVVLNTFLKNHLIESGIDAKKILVAGSGVDLDAYEKIFGRDVSSIRKELGLPTDRYIIGYTGNLSGDKIDTLVKSAKYLEEAYLIVIVGGNADDIKRTRQLITREKVDSRIRLEGHKPASRVPLYQLSSDILAMPYSRKLSFLNSRSPQKLYEYMATRKPIVSSDFEITRSILDDESCVFIEPNDPKAMSEAFELCVKDRSFSRSISERAFDTVQNFSYEKRAKRVMDFISNLQ